MKRILTGLKPSGELTLGSYIGGIKGTIKRQEEYESFLFVPDMHAITVRQEHDLLKERIRKNVALYYKQNKNFRFYIFTIRKSISC